MLELPGLGILLFKLSFSDMHALIMLFLPSMIFPAQRHVVLHAALATADLLADLLVCCLFPC